MDERRMSTLLTLVLSLASCRVNFLFKNRVLMLLSSPWRSRRTVPKCHSQSPEPDDNPTWHVLNDAAATGRATPKRWLNFMTEFRSFWSFQSLQTDSKWPMVTSL
ncbi:unnamed protein product [Oikopleura dioica]|uniref:Uncharacterized protein n=1 Tax=Oikopleura dioica TaxID=34765 RepID=E4XU09_OIKDI|nr:unnamed protein product [Oikopleura dioica]